MGTGIIDVIHHNEMQSFSVSNYKLAVNLFEGLCVLGIDDCALVMCKSVTLDDVYWIDFGRLWAFGGRNSKLKKKYL